MKSKQIYFLVAVSLMGLISVQLVGCKPKNPSENRDNNIEIEAESPKGEKGKTEIFSHGDFRLEITNVQGVRTENMVDDGGTPWEYKVFTCYPKAKATVLEADMSDFNFSADGKAHANWGIELVSGDPIRIADEMEPFEITPDIIGIYNLEASLYILKFDLIGE